METTYALREVIIIGFISIVVWNGFIALAVWSIRKWENR